MIVLIFILLVFKNILGVPGKYSQNRLNQIQNNFNDGLLPYIKISGTEKIKLPLYASYYHKSKSYSYKHVSLKSEYRISNVSKHFHGSRKIDDAVIFFYKDYGNVYKSLENKELDCNVMFVGPSTPLLYDYLSKFNLYQLPYDENINESTAKHKIAKINGDMLIFPSWINEECTSKIGSDLFIELSGLENELYNFFSFVKLIKLKFTDKTYQSIHAMLFNIVFLLNIIQKLKNLYNVDDIINIKALHLSADRSLFQKQKHFYQGQIFVVENIAIDQCNYVDIAHIFQKYIHNRAFDLPSVFSLLNCLKYIQLLRIAYANNSSVRTYRLDSYVEFLQKSYCDFDWASIEKLTNRNNRNYEYYEKMRRFADSNSLNCEFEMLIRNEKVNYKKLNLIKLHELHKYNLSLWLDLKEYAEQYMKLKYIEKLVKMTDNILLNKIVYELRNKYIAPLLPLKILKHEGIIACHPIPNILLSFYGLNNYKQIIIN